jgi:hypothetical protein
MTAPEFWQVIQQGKSSVKATGEIPAWLTSYLRERTVDYIVAFEEQLHEHSCLAYDARLWAAAGLMLGLCSDDKFCDFRGWLIAQGKRVFESSLESPDTLADVGNIDGDSGKPLLSQMLYAPTKAYRQKICNEIADLQVCYRKPVLLNQDTWNGDRSKLPNMFPRLFAKYGEGGMAQ